MKPARQIHLARAGKTITAAAFALALAGCSTSGASADSDDDKSTQSPAASVSASASPEAETVAQEEVAAESVEATSLKVGDCLADDPDTEEVSDVDVVPCTQPHESEVYAAMDIDAGEYPGQEAVETMAQDFCLAEFQPYIGTEYADSLVDIGYLTPTSYSWTLGNDREILCTAYRVDGEKLTSTVRNSNV